MADQAIRALLRKEKKHIAFVIGNGIHRYRPTPKPLSLDDLLLNLWRKTTGQRMLQRPEGISSTEFYDLLELRNTQRLPVQKEISAPQKEWAAGLPSYTSERTQAPTPIYF